MSNKEAYLGDLGELKELTERLLRAVPEGKTAKEKENRANAERTAGAVKALIACMESGYIPAE